MFVFGSIGQESEPHVWPIHMMHITEAVFVVSALVCLVAAMFLSMKPGPSSFKELVAIVGGISASFGLIMPFELMPFFFHVKGEAMLGTMVLVLFYPIAAVVFWALLRAAMRTKIEIAPAPLPKASVGMNRPSWQVPEVRPPEVVTRPPAAYLYGLTAIVMWLVGWPLTCFFISTARVPNWVYFCGGVLWFVSLLALYQILLWLGKYKPTLSNVMGGFALGFSLLLWLLSSFISL